VKINTEPLQADCYYHIYNRGINGENIFKEERNYVFFLTKYAQFLSPYISTYAYCLLKNHFHLLIRTHSEATINAAFAINHKQEKNISWIISNAFGSFFKSYSQAVNKAYERTGRLFEEPFRRIRVYNNAYFAELIYYIHRNPQKHGFVDDFKDYPHSSYHTHLLTSATKLQRDEVISWLGDKKAYEKFHSTEHIIQNLDKFEIELD
jgi:putative transposase